MRSRISENSWYFLAFVLALGLRLLNLGAAPLNDNEAQWAMQALELGRSTASVGSHPGYVMLTHLLFSLLPSTNALARLIPATHGSLIVFLPTLLRAAGSRLNFPRTAAIILAFGLAVDPTLAVLSRQVGSSAAAVTCGLLALAAILARRPILAGIFGGLALLSGPAVLLGALGLAIASGLVKLLEKADWIAPLGSEDELPPVGASFDPRAMLRNGLYALGATILVTGTLFLAYPLGLSGLAASLTSFLSGWGTASTVSPGSPLIALIIYETLPLIFGVIGIGKGWYQRNGLSQRLSLWLMAALVLPIIYPARQVGDLAWALIPLWGLAAIELAQLATSRAEQPQRWVSALHALFLFILLVVLRLNLLAWQTSGVQQPMIIFGVQLSAFAFLAIGILAMGVIATLMVAVGWSGRMALDGLVGALLVGGTLSLLSATFWGTQARPNSALDLWTVVPAAGQVDLLTQTIEHLSVSQKGLQDQVDILATLDTPSMHWALRGFSKVRFAAQLAITEQPSIVITPQDQVELQSSSSYRGQDFVWANYPGWQGSLPPSWLPWLAFRNAPLAQSTVIVWARADLFPETSDATQP